MWQKPHIPAAEEGNIIAWMEKIATCSKLVKGRSHCSAAEIIKEMRYQHDLPNLFDVAHVEAMQLIQILKIMCFLQPNLENLDSVASCLESIHL